MFGGNVGSSARAVKNTGLGGLQLVASMYEDEKEAVMFSHGAEEILEAAPRHDELEHAIEGRERVVGFTARRRTRRRIASLREFAEAWVEDALLDGPPSTALLFGNERDGMTTAEMDHCTEMVWIPAVPEHPSYNLAQAVLLVGYELLTARLARDKEMPKLKPRETRPPKPDHPSPIEEQDELFEHLREAFLAISYAYPHTVDPMIRSYREMFSRARLYSREAKMLRGLARQMQWMAEQVEQANQEEKPGD